MCPASLPRSSVQRCETSLRCAARQTASLLERSGWFGSTQRPPHAVRLLLQGRNTFITGAAGTGKTELLKEIIRRAPRASFYATATTGE